MAKRNVKEINESQLNEIFNLISENKEESLGWYYFKDLKILVYLKDVSKKRQEAVSKMFKKLREEGRCLYCGTIVEDINPNKNKKYCKCRVHRKLTKIITDRKKILANPNATQEEIERIEKEFQEIKRLDQELREKEKRRRKEEREKRKK